MVNAKTLALIFVLASPLIGAAKDKDVKLDARTCVRKVFVTGRQTIAVSWANDNLATKTCMQPVSTPDEAEAILDLEPDREPLTKVQYQPDDSGYSVQCSGSVGATRCVDTNGQELSTSCTGSNGQVVCSSYYGPSLVSAIGEVGRAIVNYSLRNSASAHMFDKNGKLIWSYTGSFPWQCRLAEQMKCKTVPCYKPSKYKANSDTCPAK